MRSTYLEFATAALAASLAGATRASAQTPDTTRQRDSTRTPTPGAVLAPVEVRASIAPTTGTDVGSGIPARITIVGPRTLRDHHPRLLTDALASAPGVSTYDDLGSPEKLTLATRGFLAGPTIGLPPGITVFLDGVRQNEPDAQEVNFDLLPMAQVTRIELLHGTASLLGPNSLGGAVNLITGRGHGTPHGSVTLSAGSFGGAALRATASGSETSEWNYTASAGTTRERGWRYGTASSGWELFANAGHRSGRHDTRVQGFATRSRAATAGSLPESIFRTAPRTNFTPGDVDDMRAEQLAISTYSREAGATAYLRRSRANRFNVNQPPDPNVRTLTRNATAGLTADWRRTLTSGKISAALRIGLDASASSVRVMILTEPGDTAVHHSLTTDVSSRNWDAAGFAVADVHSGPVTLSAGARYDHVRIPYRDRLDPSGNGASTFRNFAPRAGITAALGPTASLYASAGTSFRAPAILELGCADPDATCPLPFALGDDPPLHPVRATTYETGGQILAGTTVLAASAYLTAVRNEIFFVSSPAALYAGYFTNLPRTRREGIEISASGAAPRARLEWYGSYAWTHATFETAARIFSVRASDTFAGRSPLAGANDVTPGDRIPLVPAYQIKGGTSAGWGRTGRAGLDVRYTGPQWLRGDEANETRPLPPYAAIDAHASYMAGPWTLSATASNIAGSRAAIFGTFNENRRTRALERFLTPATARTITITLRRAMGRDTN